MILKKLLILIFLCFLFSVSYTANANEKTWQKLSLDEKEKLIGYYHDIIFTRGYTKFASSEEFKNKYGKYFKDKDYKEHFANVYKAKPDPQITQRYQTKIDCPANLNDIHLGYTLFYKSEPNIGFFYNSAGSLQYIEFYSPSRYYPYILRKYNTKGKLLQAIYVENPYSSYLYFGDETFKGYYSKNLGLLNKRNMNICNDINFML